jgi:hypothetical protein
VVEVTDFQDDWGCYALEDELSDAVANSDLKLMLAKVEEEDVNDATIITIDNTGASHKSEPGSKTTSGGDTSIGAFRDDDGELSID